MVEDLKYEMYKMWKGNEKHIKWTCDNCTEKLEKLGWEVYGQL